MATTRDDAGTFLRLMVILLEQHRIHMVDLGMAICELDWRIAWMKQRPLTGLCSEALDLLRKHERLERPFIDDTPIYHWLMKFDGPVSTRLAHVYKALLYVDISVEIPPLPFPSLEELSGLDRRDKEAMLAVYYLNLQHIYGLLQDRCQRRQRRIQEILFPVAA